jgi:glyoxylase-like metal-dependent hydrolase (beta-lactamase superfamily II)
MSINCLLVRAAGKTILIDTGLGDNMSDRLARNWALVRPDGGLLASLALHGVAPEDIDVVIDTHLHGDHCAGNVIIDGDSVKPRFPKAEYVTQRKEYLDAMQPNERTRATYIPLNYQPLVESGQMRLLTDDSEIVPGIHGVITRGHTPAHMCIRFDSAGKHGLFMADLATYAVHFERLGWTTSYDVEPLETIETKRRWQHWALQTDALLIWQHDPKIRTGHLRKEGEKYHVEPVELHPARY